MKATIQQENSSWGNKQFLSSSEAAGYLYQSVPIMDGMSGSRILRNGQELTNFAGINVLGLQEDKNFIFFVTRHVNMV